MLVQEALQVVADSPESGDWCLLKVDLANAFNSVSRQRILTEVGKKAPHLLPWTQRLYGEELSLFMGHDRVASRRGVQQGCNFGTFLFALAIQPVVENLTGLWLNRWYADDGVLLGPVETVNNNLGCMCQSFREIGLEVNLSKCEMWGPGATLAANRMEDSPLKQCRLIPWDTDSGTVVLGTPVHHPTAGGVGNRFVLAWWEQKVEALRADIAKVVDLGDAHVQHLLLSSCLTTSKVEHALRASDTRGCQRALDQLRDALLDGVNRTLACAATKDQAQQIFLPTREGGMGYRDPTLTWAGSRLAASAGFMRDLQRDDDLHTILDPLEGVCPMGTAEAIEQLRSKALVGQMRLQGWATTPVTLRDSCPPDTASSVWNARQHKAAAGAWKAEGTSRDQIRKSLIGPASMSWCSVAPVAARSNLLGHEEFRLTCKFFLGIPVIEDEHAGCPCPKCGRPLDVWGDHAVSCQFNGLTDRHCLIRDKVTELARRAGLTATKEEALPDGDRPADVLIKRWDAKGTAAVDVTCTHPLKVSDNNTTVDMARKSLQVAEDIKVRRYQDRCAAVEWNFIPVVCHPFGAWHGQGKSFVRRLIEKVAKEEAAGDVSAGPSHVSAELPFLMAHIMGRELAITLDAGFHEAVAPKRPRRTQGEEKEPEAEDASKRPRRGH